MIIENVPFIEDKEEKYESCQGLPTTMMAFKFFLPNLSINFDELYKKLGYKRGNWFFETYIVSLFKEFNVPALYYSTKKLKKCKNKECFKRISGLDFNNKEATEEFNLKHYNSAIDFVKKHKLFRQMKEISLDFIKEQISNSKLVIATLNRNKLQNKEGYKGHFILIRGFTDNSFICNDALLGEGISMPFSTFADSFYYINWEKPNDKTEYIKDVVVIG